ncbi:3beta-hydroxysteroid-dehydrogenase/decarboxylase-like [Olea europaea var. sylvestris]|uniref:3beta-hydroxysteroid- dehydrogenase/decarboxylase-like n=1 Tax=Olea europaea var. sylvestris TaxID=158386 RepID=UPI000C1CE5D6|nr:3beta-hydroxysteroid-dehydrogenase/decarboxylase-like [Olea europaea var. sylvestris]
MHSCGCGGLEATTGLVVLRLMIVRKREGSREKIKMVEENGSHYDDRQLKTCVVIGGRGFIGRSLVERLLKLGNWIVRVIDSYPSPQILPSESILSQAFSSGRALYFRVDPLNKPQIIKGINIITYNILLHHRLS